MLNAEQTAAVRSLDSPLVIIAGAGTGKTHTLAHRCAHLIRTGIPPEKMLLLSYTNAAADEIRERAGKMVYQGDRIFSGTFHSYAYQMLRQHGHLIGLGSFTVEKDTKSLSFDELLDKLQELLTRNPEIVKERCLLVDEAQDMNVKQLEIVRRLEGLGLSLTLVGDPCQSIYGFQGAVPAVMSDLAATAQRTIYLVRNYRAGQRSLDFANRVIQGCPGLLRKDLVSSFQGTSPCHSIPADDEEEARFVAASIADLLQQGVPAHEIAVLYRSSLHSMQMQLELLRRQIPFVMRGGSLFRGASFKGGSSQDRVLLSTVHSVKGMEFQHVFVTGLSDGCFTAAAPGTEAYYEDVRLFYVACTRTRKQLDITSPLAFRDRTGKLRRASVSSLIPS